MKSGLNKIYPHRKDKSLLHSFGATTFDTQGLPANFSVYGGQLIPNQDLPDTRFSPPLPPLPMACTGESTSFICSLEDTTKLFNPQFTYIHTPPGIDGEGRDIRAALQSAIDTGLEDSNGVVGYKRLAYFNVYGAGAIDDYDACKIALWINQDEKRAVSVGSYYYSEFVENVPASGIAPTPSFNTSLASMHNWIVTGWTTINGVEYLETIPWIGMNYAANGKLYMSRAIYNGLMGQPWSGAFSITKVSSVTPVPIGYTAIIDHLIYFVRNLFGV